MAKIRVLLAGNQDAVMDDFFLHTDDEFQCMSSSDRLPDMLAHIQYFDPEVFVYCMGRDNARDTDNLRAARHFLENSDAVFVVIGDADDIASLNPLIARSVHMSLEKPLSIKTIEKDILAKLECVLAEREARRAEEERIEKLAREEEKSREKKHVLVIDDDPLMLRTIKRYLEDRYVVATAPSGKFGLKYLSQKHADIVLLDYEMPEMSGREVFEAIKADERLLDIPVVFLTGISDSNMIKSVLALKPNAYLLKPVDSDRLEQTLDSLLA